MSYQSHFLYNGIVELLFHEDSHTYYVHVNGEDRGKVESATSILNVISKPQLVQWAANQAVEHFQKNLRPGTVVDELLLRELCDDAKKAHKQTSKKATDIGTEVHNWIERYINKRIEHGSVEVYDPMHGDDFFMEDGPSDMTLPFHELIRKGVEEFLDWEAQHDVEWIASEKKVYSIDHHYAGTLDIKARIDGALELDDIKTSRAIYDEYFIQTACYIMAEEEEDPSQHFERARIIRLPKKKGDKFEVKTIERPDIEHLMGVFLHAHGLNRWKQTWKPGLYS